MIKFTVDGNNFSISGQRSKRFHNGGDHPFRYYAYKNNRYVTGTTSNSPQDCLQSLGVIENWTTDILNKIKKDNLNEFVN